MAGSRLGGIEHPSALSAPSTVEKQKQTKGKKVMNDKFDELAKAMAQSVTRRGALKKFGLGVAGIALASLGLANRAYARGKCHCNKPDYGCRGNPACVEFCAICCAGGCF
jgi:hypothetical protein